MGGGLLLLIGSTPVVAPNFDATTAVDVVVGACGEIAKVASCFSKRDLGKPFFIIREILGIVVLGDSIGHGCGWLGVVNGNNCGKSGTIAIVEYYSRPVSTLQPTVILSFYRCYFGHSGETNGIFN